MSLTCTLTSSAMLTVPGAYSFNPYVLAIALDSLSLCDLPSHRQTTNNNQSKMGLSVSKLLSSLFGKKEMRKWTFWAMGRGGNGREQGESALADEGEEGMFFAL